ncbi:MAG: 3-oxoacid CoA-transferase subunit A [Kosmotoga sp.]|nr:MAG: 3-oxoacid CoA-transferase subunit A [Kosmotoga sp.]
MNKLIYSDQIAELVDIGDTVMVGGFLGCGAPETIITKLIDAGIGEFHMITNDTAFPEKGCGRLIANKLVKKLTASHIGTNPETINQMINNELEVELVPQGTLAEKIRAAGAGLGGILTPTGIGTEVENGKRKIEVNNKEFLLEEAIEADVALIKARKADTWGNLAYRLTAQNFNPLMATAAKLVIAEVEEIVEVGELEPDEIVTPHIFVDYIVKSSKRGDRT